MTKAYIEGFCKTAEQYGIDPENLVKIAGPRPEEREWMQRLANNPASLRALTNPITGAPPRIDDPVWNPGRVQVLSTLGQLAAPAAVYTAAAKPCTIASWGKEHIPAAIASLALCTGSTLGGLHIGKKLFEGDTGLSRVQRMRDADDIMNGRKLRPALWKDPTK